MIPVPKVTAPPKIQQISVRDWLKGTVTAFDDGRTPIDGLRASGNVMLDQDGTLRPRPSLVPYGVQPTGTVLGEIFEFVKTTSSGSENWIIFMQVVGGVARPYVAKDGGTPQITTGKTYNITADTHFCQVDDKVLVMNGTDNLSYFDITTAGTTNTIVPFTALADPSAPSITRTGMVGTTYTYYYKITANSTVGETAASVAASQQVLLLRDAWDSTTNYLTITWAAVPSAISYNVYMGDSSGQEVLIAAGITGLSYKDDGIAAPDITRPAPLSNTTAGPKVKRATVINGQVFLTEDADNIRYVRYGGFGKNVLDFSPFNGGGWVEIGRGTKEFPVKVMPFRDGRGNAAITVLCKGTNGSGKRYILNPQTTTIGETIISYFEVIEDNGQSGTESPDAVVLYRDSLWYPSRDGFKTTGTKPQLQNILSTDTVSETIINDISRLNSLYMNKAVGLASEQRIYFAVPVGSSYNSEIWVLDLQRKGAWMKPWNVRADWMTLYNDNSGQTRHLVLSNNKIYELTTSRATQDDTTPFSTNATSGFIKFNEPGNEWAKVIDITFVLLRPQGSISFSVAGKTEESSLQTVGQDTFTSSVTVAGWGEAGWGGAEDAIFGWSNFEEVPIQYGDAQRYVTIEIDEELQWITWELNTTQAGVEYQLADVIIRYVNIGVKDLA